MKYRIVIQYSVDYDTRVRSTTTTHGSMLELMGFLLFLKEQRNVHSINLEFVLPQVTATSINL